MIDTNKIKTLVREFLIAIGENPEREGLIETPRRVADMCKELLEFSGDKNLHTNFQAENYGGIVLVRDIDFSSLCEHHIMPFIGKVHIAYIPDDKVIGISKLARIIDKHSKNLQIQERLANTIADELMSAINAKGVAIYIEAKHLCMNIRGIRRNEAKTITTAFKGDFNSFEMQNVFVNLIKQ